MPLEALNREHIIGLLNKDCFTRFNLFEVFDVIDSTNTYLINKAKLGHLGDAVCIADAQKDGRGRGQKVWHSPSGANLYLSLLFTTQAPRAIKPDLSLWVAIAIAQCLVSLTGVTIKIKWPNDLMVKNQKLGGVLLETFQPQPNLVSIVIGIGINFAMSALKNIQIDQPWTDLISHTKNRNISRNELAAEIIQHISDIVERYLARSLMNLPETWTAYDALENKSVKVLASNNFMSGKVRGINASGHLIVELQDGVQAFSSAEVRISA